MRPELKVWKALKENDEALTKTSIQEKTGMHYYTVKGVLASLDRLNKLETVETSGFTYYKPILHVSRTKGEI